MEQTDVIKDIINYALNKAISGHDSNMMEKCFSAGACVTQRSIKTFKSNMLYLDNEFRSASKCGERAKIFELLLKYGFDVITNNISFIVDCVRYRDKYYIQSIINAGFNSDHTQSVEILKKIICLYWKNEDGEDEQLKILLNNGFCRHIQPLLMYCITESDRHYLSLFIEYGANCYSLLSDLHILSQQSLNSRIRKNIRFVLTNIFEIGLLKEPIHKYFLIKLVQYDIFIPTEIPICIFQCYMLLDYEHKDDILRKISNTK